EDLRRFRVEEEWILQAAPGSSTFREGWSAFERLMAFECRRARDFYREAATLPTAAERPDLRAAEIMMVIYQDLLRRIERAGPDIFRRRVRVPVAVKVALALKAWWKSR